jgi:tetratricopeptide (TPR) repeat protein
MTIELSAGQIEAIKMGATWVWEAIGKKIVKSSIEKAKSAWGEFRWDEAEYRYKTSIYRQVCTTSVLGNPTSIKIDNIYTDAYVLDKLTAQQRISSEDLENHEFSPDVPTLKAKRLKAEQVVKKHNRLFLLGKPGAGKTTFLKHLAMLCCSGKIQKTPLFIPLKEWADSGQSLLSFIGQQFDTCGFPNAAMFVDQVLESGQALVLLDGLDEVFQEGVEKARLLKAITSFSEKYSQITICITCRTAANEYQFQGFSYLEVADFSDEQQDAFISKWFGENPKLFATFKTEWKKDDNAGLRDLGRTPLLLTLICLAFNETLAIPRRKVELYSEALDALLKKWDSSRAIQRAEKFRVLSIERKKQLLARLASISFKSGKYLFKKEYLIAEVKKYIKSLPVDDESDDFDPDGIIQALEVQHGIVIERAHRVYGFSHLTLQEYFTARYIIESANRNRIHDLAHIAFRDPRWREVALMVASMLDDATDYLMEFCNAADELIQESERLPVVIGYCSDIISESPLDREISSLIFSKKAGTGHAKDRGTPTDDPNKAGELIYEATLDLVAEFDIWPLKSRPIAERRARNLAILIKRALSSKMNPIDRLLWMIFKNSEETYCIHSYLRGMKLLVECVRLAYVPERAKIDTRLLTTPALIRTATVRK